MSKRGRDAGCTVVVVAVGWIGVAPAVNIGPEMLNPTFSDDGYS